MREHFPLYLLCMAGVTYLLRALPMVLVKEKIKNKFILSFLYYIPYTVLAAMVVPAVFFATDNIACAAIGFAVAVIFAFFKKGLVTVASAACIAVFLSRLAVEYLPFL